jgi:hypothetical protein
LDSSWTPVVHMAHIPKIHISFTPKRNSVSYRFAKLYRVGESEYSAGIPGKMFLQSPSDTRRFRFGQQLPTSSIWRRRYLDEGDHRQQSTLTFGEYCKLMLAVPSILSEAWENLYHPQKKFQTTTSCGTK